MPDDERPSVLEEFVTLHSATVVCAACPFVVQVDGGRDEDELREMCLQVSKLHGRQRHGDVTSFQTSFGAYEAPSAPTDTEGRPRRAN